MKNIVSLIIALFFTYQGIAQNDNSGSYKNWVVDYTKSRSSFEGVQLDKLELNDNYTIAYMSFHNWGMGMQHIEACNTFHIRSKGKKIATFIKAQNIPTRYVDKIGFTCADESTSMKIRPGQFVRFRIYFTRIPEYLNAIDIIEYDGYRQCEFDIFNLNISKKEPLPPQNYAMAKKPQTNKIPLPPPVVQQEKPIAQQTKPEKPKTRPVKPPVSATPKPTEEEAVIAAKSITEPEKKVTVPVSKVENRDVSVRREYQVKSKVLQLELWDNDKEDGDQVSIMLNNRWVVKGVAVTKNKKKFEFPLQLGENVLTFHADNLGTAPPNTAAIKFFDGSDEQTIVLNSDMDKSEAIRLIRN
jgi:hypothetical protein